MAKKRIKIGLFEIVLILFLIYFNTIILFEQIKDCISYFKKFIKK